jgi:hypothetical protein
MKGRQNGKMALVHNAGFGRERDLDIVTLFNKRANRVNCDGIQQRLID